MSRLFDSASLSVLADDDGGRWRKLGPHVGTPRPLAGLGAVLSAWLDSAAEGLASAILSSAALLELEAVLIDGWMPVAVRAEVVRRTDLALRRLDLSGISPVQVREGTVGAQARSLGAAAIPLSQRY